MKIAIIGSGNLASVLGTGWARAGHDVAFGVRNPTAAKTAALMSAAGGRARVGTIGDAAAASDVIAMGVPWTTFPEVLAQMGDITGKVLLASTNPLKDADFSDPNHVEALAVGFTDSGAETVARWAPSARVVLAFNAPGVEVMADAAFGPDRPTMVICGDDAAAKRTASQLAEDLGFDACDVGALRMARYAEPMAMLWIDMSRNQKRGSDFAFRLLQRRGGLASAPELTPAGAGTA